jgi:hypothetical protein
MKLPPEIQAHVNDFCAQTGEKYCHAGSLFDLLYDIDPDVADAFLANPDVDDRTRLFPGPVAVS